MTATLSTLPPLPPRMARLPVDARGYPVPWFVTWLENGVPCRNGQGAPDFRVVQGERVVDAIRLNLCWICGDRLGAHKSFVIGPMCAINRTSSEPPSHLECADFAARACPFLVRPAMRRREAGMPEGHQDAAGHMIRRNPGVALVWTTKRFETFPVDGGAGLLIDVGEPLHVRWSREGRPATRTEVLESINSGLPELQRVAEFGGVRDIFELARRTKAAMKLIPAEEAP